MDLNQENQVIAFLVKMSSVVGLMTAVVVVLVAVVIFLEIKAPDLAFREEVAVVQPATEPTPSVNAPADGMWQAPDLASIPATPEGDQIRYGRELIAHTARYLGPKGSVLHVSNGMNCQNCHLDAGTKPFGNNYSLVATTYPKFRARSGAEEDVVKRVNDCFERSLNGKGLEPDSKEMQAIVAYIKWVGQDVKKDEKPSGSGFTDIALLDRAASPEKGKLLYTQKCQVCHGADGEGIQQVDGAEYLYPPLWGQHSYNDGAGLYRISNFARYVKANMPLGATYATPQLTDEEAWDLAAYVNSMPRPKKDITKKPFDHPFGPFSDTLSEAQHKYGPFKPMQEKK